jgi:hypothetical protein
MARSPSKPTDTNTTQAASPAASITPEALQAMFDSVKELKATVARYQAEAEAVIKAEKAPAATTKSASNDLAAVRAFKKAGFGVLTPRAQIKTFNRWVEAGFRPIEGSKAVKVANLRLFCQAQCRPITSADKKALAEQKAKFEARKGSATVVPINGQAEIPV